MTPPEGSTGSRLSHLEGSLSGTRYPADALASVDPVDQRPLLARYDLVGAAGALAGPLRGGRSLGMWRWAPLLPVADWGNVVSLGEGATPLLRPRRLARLLRCPGLMVKAENVNPTGSFKSRGMSAAVSRAVELGATSLVAPSAGNAAGALATYGAAAGAAVAVLVPADAPEANRVEVLASGARLVLVDGLISDCGRLSAQLAAHTGAFDVATLREPHRLEGKKTMGYELAEDLGWQLPDVVVYPTGGGTGLVGMWKAFAELQAAGLVGGDRPRMISVQSEGCAPIVRAFDRGQRFAEPWEGAATRASGIRVPAAVGDFLVLDAVRASRGLAVAVPEEAIDELQLRAGAAGAGYVSPETAAGFAAVRLLRERGELDSGDRVVVFDTGIGHKYPAPAGVPRPEVIPADADADRLLAAAGDPGRDRPAPAGDSAGTAR